MDEINNGNIEKVTTNEENIEIINNDDFVTNKEKLILFLSTFWRPIISLMTPILLIPLLTPFPPQKYQWCGYTLVLMAIYWVTECIPLPITAFLPIFIFPLANIMNTTTTSKCYMNDTIFMFIGSMALAYAVQQSGLHKRLALCAIRNIGYSHYRLLFAMCFTTMFVSMWITNTAATTMMVPINFALLKVFEDQNLLKIFETTTDGDNVASAITTCYFCASTFSATIGGIGTLVGTATNLVFKGLFEKTFPNAPEFLSFPKFSAFAIPYMIVLEMFLYMSLLIIYLGFLRPNSAVAKRSKISKEGMEAAEKAVMKDWTNLGRITYREIIVIILFVGAMLMFFCRSPKVFDGWGDKISIYFNLDSHQYVQDSACAILIVTLMLLLPSTLDFFKNFTAKLDELPDKPIAGVLTWSTMNDVMPYSFMLLLGSGFALSTAANKEYSDLNGQIGVVLKKLNTLPNYLIIFMIIIFTTFVTNFAANVAVANVLVPLTMQLAVEVDVHPLWYNIVTGFTASYCFCLPVGTPGNLIVQSVAKIPTITMIIAGALPTLTTIIMTWIAMCFWAPVVWPELHYPILNNTWIKNQ